MPGVKEAILSLRIKLQELPSLKFVAIWNNQLNQDEEGQIYSFPKPAAFIEARTPNPFLPIVGGYGQSDVTFVIHVLDDQYNNTGGTFEQNITVFDVKAEVVTLLTGFKPDQCGPLMKIAEGQDYEHTNLYHYTIEFLTGLIDTAGSGEDQGAVITKDPPTGLIIETEVLP